METSFLKKYRRHVRPELGLSHRHQRRGRHGEVVVVLLRLVRRLVRDRKSVV